MKKIIAYLVLALFCAVVLWLFGSIVMGGAVAFPFWEALGFIAFLAAFFAAAFGIRKAIDYIRHKRTKHSTFSEDHP